MWVISKKRRVPGHAGDEAAKFERGVKAVVVELCIKADAGQVAGGDGRREIGKHFAGRDEKHAVLRVRFLEELIALSEKISRREIANRDNWIRIRILPGRTEDSAAGLKIQSGPWCVKVKIGRTARVERAGKLDHVLGGRHLVTQRIGEWLEGDGVVGMGCEGVLKKPALYRCGGSALRLRLVIRPLRCQTHSPANTVPLLDRVAAALNHLRETTIGVHIGREAVANLVDAA